MLRYYAWALSENVLSILPGGEYVYTKLGYVVNRHRRGFGQYAESLRLARRASELVPPGGVVLDLGTGWYHREALTLFLTGGEYEFVLFDVQDKARIEYVRNYVADLLANAAAVSAGLGVDEAVLRERLREIESIPTLERLYRHCNFRSVVNEDPLQPFAPPKSLDFVVSNCVLPHIPPNVLHPELSLLRDALKDDGRMLHLVGHDDHWAFRDPSANTFNFLRYSDRTYRRLFETKFEYHNRIPNREWFGIFERAGLRVEDYFGDANDDTRGAIAALPKIDGRFAGLSRDDLAVFHSYFLLQKADTSTAGAPPVPGRS